MQKKTPRTTNSAKIPLPHLTERYLTNWNTSEGYLWRNLRQMSSRLGLFDGAIVWQHFLKFTWRLSHVLETGQILGNGSYNSTFSVTSLSEINNSEKPNILHNNSSVTTKISTTHFSFFPTVILVTEVTTLTVHPESCYCEREFLSTSFCSSFSVLPIKKSKLK